MTIIIIIIIIITTDLTTQQLHHELSLHRAQAGQLATVPSQITDILQLDASGLEPFNALQLKTGDIGFLDVNRLSHSCYTDLSCSPGS